MLDLTFSIIGTGHVGTSILFSLKNAGGTLIGISEKDQEKGNNIAKRYNCLFEAIPEHILSADVIFITTDDKSIKQVAEEVREKTDAILCHTSGIYSSFIFKPHRGICSLHPVLPVYKDFMDLKGKLFSIEGDEEGIEMAKRIVESIGGKFFIIDGDKKGKYHLASVIGANFITTLAYICTQLYKEAGANENLCTSIIEETLNAIKEKGLPDALTGPVVRGDIETIKEDIKAVKDHPEWRDAIIKLFELNTLIAKEKNKDEKILDNILDMLATFSKD